MTPAGVPQLPERLRLDLIEELGTEHQPVYQVEFSGADGQAYAFAELRPEQLIIPHRRTMEA